MPPEVRLTRSDALSWSDHRSGMLIQPGVSEALVGSQGVFMTRQRIPPGMQSTPHLHLNCETACSSCAAPFDALRRPPGARTPRRNHDFLYIPQDAVHQIVNPSPDEEAEVVLCRNAAEEIVREVELEPR